MTSADNPSVYPFIYIMSWKEYYGHLLIGHNNSHMVNVAWQHSYLMNRWTYHDLMHTLDMKPYTSHLADMYPTISISQTGEQSGYTYKISVSG
jgi:uncharacterized protein (DUF2062 family)